MQLTESTSPSTPRRLNNQLANYILFINGLPRTRFHLLHGTSRQQYRLLPCPHLLRLLNDFDMPLNEQGSLDDRCKVSRGNSDFCSKNRETRCASWCTLPAKSLTSPHDLTAPAYLRTETKDWRRERDSNPRYA